MSCPNCGSSCEYCGNPQYTEKELLTSWLVPVIILLFLTLLLGCDNGSIPVQKEDCKSISIDVYWKAKAKGYEARIVTGTIENSKGHRWVEYNKNGKWLVWDEAIWNVGKSPYTANELGYTTYYTTPPRLLTNKIFIRPDSKPFCMEKE